MSGGQPGSAGSGGSGGGSQPGQHLDYAALPTWQDPAVAQWLSTSLPSLPSSYADLFASNDIRGAVLLEVDQSALKEMGVRSVGDRVKICVAVRQLRGKYLAVSGGGAASGARNSVLGRVTAQGGASRPGSPLVHSLPSSATSSPVAHSPPPPQPNTSGFTQPTYGQQHPPPPGSIPSTVTAGFALGHSRPGSGSYSARSLSTGNRIPPPLHLAQSNVFHHSGGGAVTPTQAAAGAAAGGGMGMLSASPPSRATSPRSATFAPPRPLAAPPPSGRIPPPPSAAGSTASSTNWLGDIPGLSSSAHTAGMTASASTSSLAALRSNSIPHVQSSSYVGGGSTTPSTSSSSASAANVPGHRKASSSSIATLRPSTAGASSSPYAGHPYASSASSGAAASSSPGAGLLPSPLVDSRSPGRPSTAQPSSSSSSTPSAGAGAAAGISSTDLMRKAVKFSSADGVTSRVLAVADAKDGREVLARVMRKFGGREGEDVNGWGVWTVEAGGGARLLTEHDLYQICQNASAPERARGLIVRRHHTVNPSLSTSPPTSSSFASQPSSPSATSTSFPGSNSSPSKRGRKLQWVFGESHAPSAELTRPGGTVSFASAGGAAGGAANQHSPTSPNYLGVEIPRMGIEPASPSTSGSGDELEAGQRRAQQAAAAAAGAGVGARDEGVKARRTTTKMNRASTVSVMSGLEAPEWARDYYAQGEMFGAAAAAEKDKENQKGERDFRVASPPQRTSSRRTPPSPYTPSSPPLPSHAASPPRLSSESGHLLPSAAAAAAASATATTRKLRNFFGQRPPSELITNHLTEYFPLSLRQGRLSSDGTGDGARTRLSKQVRASIRRSMSAAAGGAVGVGGAMGRRMSTASVASRASSSSRRATVGIGVQGVPALPSAGTGTSWDKGRVGTPVKEEGEREGGAGPTTSRFSGSSSGSAELHITNPSSSSASAPSTSAAGLPIPTPAGGDASSIRSGRSPRSSSGSALDPPDEADEDAEEEGLTPPRLSSSPESTRMVAADSAASAASSGASSLASSTSTTVDDADVRSIASRSSLAAPSYLAPRRLSRRLSRMSGASSSRLSVGAQSLWERRSKDSDAASVITMDEVTADLETRRASGVSWGGGYSDEESDAESEEVVVVAGDEEEEDAFEEGFEGEDGFSDDEEDEDEYSDEEDVDEEEPGTAKAENKGMKWIKGALIGQGSFGSVYLGMNPLTGSLMAVKQVELPTGNSHNEERKKGMLDALEREIELLKVLQHDNIVQYLDSSTDAQHLNIFLEYVPGGSVAALLQNYGAFEEALVSKFVRQILTGLDYLHEREIIHRDIKGANILVDNKGNIKISDFGISKKVEDNLLSGAKVHRPSLQGSVYWMAPEVVKQTAYTSKADIWSLGCLVVEMLTGAHPWANLTQMQAIFRIGSSIRPTVPDDISNEADDFLEQTFEIEHTDRPSARELLLHAFIRDPDAFAASQQTPTRATFSQQQQQQQQQAAQATVSP
ncbi:hypothetical protein JCM8097_000669 [Rhodosporidiobolus ruineniae]